MAMDPRGLVATRPVGLRLREVTAPQTPLISPRGYPDTGGADLVGQAGARIGAAIAGFADALDAVSLREERIAAARGRAEDRTHWAERLQALKEQAPPGADGFTKTLSQEFDAYSATRLDSATSPRMRDEVEVGLLNLRGQVVEDALSFESGARLAKRRSDVEEIRRLNGNAVARDIGQFGGLMTETENAIRDMGLPPTVADQEIRTSRRTLAEAGLMGLATRNPAAAMIAIKSGGWDAHVDPDRLMRLYEHAETEDRRRRAEARQQAAERRAAERAEVEPLLRDEFAAYARGKSFANPVPESRIVAAHGPERAARIIADRKAARQLSADLAAIAMVPPDTQARLLDSYRPEGEGFAGEAERYDTLSRAIAQDHQRRKDPAQYVLDHSPALRDLLGKTDKDPAAARQAVALSLELQASAGIPETERRILPQGMAAGTVRQITSLPAEQAADVMERQAQTYGDLWPRVFGELVREKLPEAYQVLATTDHPVARKRLAEVLAQDKDALRQVAGTDARRVDDAVSAALTPLARSLDFAPDGPAALARYTEAARRLGYANAPLQGAEKAGEQAVRDIITGRYDFIEQEGGITARVPKGQAERVQGFASRTLESLTDDDLPDLGGGPTLTPAQRKRMLRQSLARGVWVTNERDDGLVLLDARRQPVHRADGRRVEFRFADVTDPEPAPWSPEAFP